MHGHEDENWRGTVELVSIDFFGNAPRGLLRYVVLGGEMLDIR